MKKFTDEIKKKIFNLGWDAAKYNKNCSILDSLKALEKITGKLKNEENLLPFVIWSNGHIAYKKYKIKYGEDY